MPEQVKLPRKLSQEPGAPAPQRPSHQRIIEELDSWANSPGLQPPTEGDEKNPDDSKACSRL
ncbi:hypothetical protein MTX26_03505 [Bradyrhizobium sp. ISRA443]|uniref:hypothetical protein n=1 Tax=unclassified Bradyrhizobium TaxID=2631580 RepID=UPI00247A10DA|nr:MULTISPECIES: hypothetical protein [unclassified Bradyrhizobium]WGR95055.1 hypothetical protein MTX20_13610 [Bradyrhizobium sp. ISRA435]WGR99942.1 hypothetical protein MTX23_03505 [Bradyrhizobium sp. ISRA436]WGS06833.1 hypothetical protein MTX18_03505 [Bradyrhizobium sp. ISRA437]WGS13715.1 hypothetical protein MTX26_03505 [Bradyrhizobium sp. ISRA443]